MYYEANTVEDLLEHLVGLQSGDRIDIEKSDIGILSSIGRQVFKGIPLTDRQLDVVKEKLQKYQTGFVNLQSDFELAISTLRMPLRQIDRAKYIKVVSHVEMVGSNTVYESYKEKWKWIKIRFPFTKKIIIKIDDLKFKIDSDEYFHEKGSHEHFFRYTEKNIFKIIKEFKNNSFEIDNAILDLYKHLEVIANNPSDYTRSISKDFELKNFPADIEELVIDELGKPNIENIHRFIDRSKKYGINCIDDSLLSSLHLKPTLVQKIITRKMRQAHIEQSKYTFNDVISAIIDLQRFPILIILPDNNAEDALSSSYESLKNILTPSEVTVMFRLDNDTNKSFNQFIKDKQIGSPLDNDKKVVYISNNKIPKPLLDQNMYFGCAIVYGDIRLNTNVQTYFNQQELGIYYCNELSPFVAYGLKMRIDKF